MKKLLNVLKSFTDKKSELADLRYIKYDNENKELVALGKRYLIAVKVELDINENVLIDINDLLNVYDGRIEGFGFIKEKNLKFRPYSKYIVQNPISYSIPKRFTLVDCIYNVGAISAKQIFVKTSSALNKLNLECRNLQFAFGYPEDIFSVYADVNFGTKKEPKYYEVKMTILGDKI